MKNTENITVSLNKITHAKVKEHVEDIGSGASLSGFINEAIIYYLKIRRGFRGYKTVKKGKVISEDEKI